MPTLVRLRPDPIPAIHPLPERAANGRRLAVYRDTKTVLQVPWMGVVTMAFAHYPRFYDTLWAALRPAAGSAAFVDACRRLRSAAEAEAAAMHPPPLTDALGDAGFADGEIDEIRALIEVFSHGNQPYLLIATAARLAMEGHDLPAAAPGPTAGAHGPAPDRPLTLVEPHHALPDVAALYAEIRATLGLPFVNTDYRALARWPAYFRRAWDGLAPTLRTPGYKACLSRLHDGAVSEAARLPIPPGLSAQDLRAAAAADANVDEVLAVVRLFQWLLPGLIANVALFRAQLA
ncbi:MAG: hypothetical protein AAF677_06430 [Pseudomonadota bacterium]